MATNQHDVIIIGAGLGGLACGVLLARRGLDVLVLEQGAQLGGALQSFRRAVPGSAAFSYDTGFHYVGGLGEGESLHHSFEQLGLTHLPWHRLDMDGADRVVLGRREYRMACGRDAFVETLARDFPHERAALERYADLLRTVATGDHSATERLTGVSAYDYLTTTFSDPLLVNVLSGAAMRLELRRESLPLMP